MAPFYDFHCKECDEKRELLVKMGTEKANCPVCLEEMDRSGGYRTVATGLPNGFFAIRSKTRRPD